MLRAKILSLLGTVDENVENRLDHFLECINQKDGIDDVLEWLQQIKNDLPANVTEINLNDVKDGWDIDSKTGNLEHFIL